MMTDFAAPQETPKNILDKFHKARGRNSVVYYSGFWQKPMQEATEICEADRGALFDVVNELDPNKGLDLILHTPGGSVDVAESIGNYLRAVFGTNIEVFVPFSAMSAGTMIACASRKIHMGKQSSIGPIDPQIGGLSAGYVLDEFNEATKLFKIDQSMAQVWNPILEQCYPGFIRDCGIAIKLSKEIVSNWLITGMFSGTNNTKRVADRITQELSDHVEMKSHGRQIGMGKAKEIGLIIEYIRTDKNIERSVMELHSAIMNIFTEKQTLKVVANHEGVSRFYSAAPQP